jgi:hypothetical protein
MADHNLEPSSDWEPEPEGSGRDSAGRFQPGHRHSVGNKGNAHRRRLLTEITEDDVRDAVECCRAIMKDKTASAKDRLVAANSLLDRCAGKPAMSDLSDRVESVEAALARIAEHMEMAPA